MHRYILLSYLSVTFNLGYLPSHDHSKTKTTSRTTVEALKYLTYSSTSNKLKNDSSDDCIVMRGGLISLCCYLGHDGGMEEYEAVVEFARGKILTVLTVIYMIGETGI